MQINSLLHLSFIWSKTSVVELIGSDYTSNLQKTQKSGRNKQKIRISNNFNALLNQNNFPITKQLELPWPLKHCDSNYRCFTVFFKHIFELKNRIFLSGIKTTLIYPATEKHIQKYESQPIHVIKETKEFYETITLPHLSKDQFNLKVNISRPIYFFDCWKIIKYLNKQYTGGSP